MAGWAVVAGVALVAVALGDVRSVQTNAAVAASLRRTAGRPSTWVATVGVLLLATVGAPFVYTRIILGPSAKPLTFADLGPKPGSSSASGALAAADAPTTVVPAGATVVTVAGGGPSASPHAGQSLAASVANTPTTIASPIAGTWTVGSGTQAGYSVDDTVMGQTSRVAGRTPDVTGTMQIVGTTVTVTTMTVNMQTVTCHCVHDSKYHQLLETDKYPTSMFELTQPIVIALMPPPNAVIDVPVTGNFTIHGVTRSVSFTLKATRLGARVAVNGSIPVHLEDYNIQNPNGGGLGGLSNCDIDFLVAFDRTG